MVWWLLSFVGLDTADSQLHAPNTETKTKARSTCLFMVGAVLETSDIVGVNLGVRASFGCYVLSVRLIALLWLEDIMCIQRAWKTILHSSVFSCSASHRGHLSLDTVQYPGVGGYL